VPGTLVRVSAARDWVDEHIDQWGRVLPGLDPDVEGVVTRMQFLVKHLRRAKQTTLAAHELQGFEYETLHALVRRGEPHRAGPSELAAELQMSPAAMTGRLDALEQRGFLHRRPSPDDRRKVIVQLSESGHRAWRDAIDGMGDEEQRIMGALTGAERRQVADLLRRMVLVAERSVECRSQERTDPGALAGAGASVRPAVSWRTPRGGRPATGGGA
jgi:DNA-binding MarR family transcriptional regulator